MMKKLIYLILLIMSMCFAYAQPVENVHEELTKNEMYSKIDLEHKNTRKYVSDELTRQREQFFKEIDSRATYYEREGKSMLTTTYWKIGLVIGGLMFFTVGLNQVLRLKTERTRFNKLQKHLSEAIIQDIRKEFGVKKTKEEVVDYRIKVDPKVVKKQAQDIVQDQQEFTDKKKAEVVFKEKKQKPEQSVKFGDDIVI
jgi:hypothetical protein